MINFTFFMQFRIACNYCRGLSHSGIVFQNAQSHISTVLFVAYRLNYKQRIVSSEEWWL